MFTLNTVDVNEALPRALAYLRDSGEPEQTRNGPALVAPGPVATVYREPRRRVLFDADRDANPFFHLFEALWILAGRRDVRTLAWFNSRMSNYSDDEHTFHAPYGYRLRHARGFDQIETVCRMLQKNPYDRRAVLQIWDAVSDLNARSLDIPCNDIVMLRVRDTIATFHHSGRVLDITVCCRSNDAIWGAYGANAVQFSVLQEYIAAKIGAGVGNYVQMSHNLHVYTDTPYWNTWLNSVGHGGLFVPDTPYGTNAVTTSVLDGLEGFEAGSFDRDLHLLFKHADEAENMYGFCYAVLRSTYETYFFQNVVRPMLAVYGNREELDDLDEDCDWHYAGRRWIERRVKAAAIKGGTL